MNVIFPIRYALLGKARGARAPKGYVVLDEAMVRLAETDASGAPVALRWDLPGKDAGQTGETRWYDGGHWLPAQETAERFLGKAAMAALDATTDDAAFIGTYRYADKTREELGLVSVSIDHRGAVEAAVEARAADLVVIDGELWTRVPEPFLAIEVGGDWARVGIRFDEESKRGAHRIDRIDDALEHLGALSDSGFWLPASPATVDVFLPHTVERDVEAAAIVEAGVELMAEVAPALARLDDGAIAGFVAVRRALKAEPADHDGLADGLEALIEGCGDAFRTAGSARYAVGRWRMRAIDLDMAPGFGA